MLVGGVINNSVQEEIPEIGVRREKKSEENACPFVTHTSANGARPKRARTVSRETFSLTMIASNMLKRRGNALGRISRCPAVSPTDSLACARHANASVVTNAAQFRLSQRWGSRNATKLAYSSAYMCEALCETDLLPGSLEMWREEGR